MHYKFCPSCGGVMSPAAGVHQPQQCAACGAEYFRDSKPCAGALVIRQGRVLLAKRAIEPFKGCWDIPGGFLNEGEHPEDGARREILEETGLRVRLVKCHGMYMDRYGSSSAAKWTLNIYYLAEPVDDTGPCAADDASELAWFTPGELPARMAFKHEDQVLADWRACLKQV